MSNVAVIEPSRTGTSLTVGHRPQPIVPTDFESAFRLARVVVASGMAPPDYTEPEKAVVAIMHGLEIGLPPMQALQRIAVINGRPSIWGDAAIGLVRGSGLCEYVKEWIEGEGDNRVAWCEAKRRGEPEPVKKKFSVADAKRAGLWDTRETVKRKGRDGDYEKRNDSPWFRFAERMLAMRARGFCLRDLFADVLGGLYLREEIEDDTEGRITAPTPPVPPPMIEHRAAEPTPPAPPIADTSPPAPPTPPTPPKQEGAATERQQELNPLTFAHGRGYESRKGSNIRRGAVPGEYREPNRQDEANAWQDGWDEADAELQAAETAAPLDEDAIANRFEKRLKNARDDDDLANAWEETVAIDYPRMSADGRKRVDQMYRDTQSGLRGG